MNLGTLSKLSSSSSAFCWKLEHKCVKFSLGNQRIHNGSSFYCCCLFSLGGGGWCLFCFDHFLNVCLEKGHALLTNIFKFIDMKSSHYFSAFFKSCSGLVYVSICQAQASNLEWIQKQIKMNTVIYFICCHAYFFYLFSEGKCLRQSWRIHYQLKLDVPWRLRFAWCGRNYEVVYGSPCGRPEKVCLFILPWLALRRTKNSKS